MAEGEGQRFLPAVLVVASFLPNLRAAIPGATYYFRDFTLTYFPLRSFFAGAVAEGRWPFWNRLLHEGCPVLPVFYPLELAQLLWPGPATVSWLLTLHLPIAALCCYGLARDVGASRWGAFASGAVYALGGLCMSSLNLHWFLQALALAPAVALATRRAAARGGRSLLLAGLVLALSLSTLAVEFVAQAFVIGCALGVVAAPSRRGLARLMLAGTLGLGLAALPVALMIGIVGESLRGAGLGPRLVLENSLHPLVLLQTLLPDLAGSIADPLEAWWGGRLYSGGSPYFLTLYLGPVALALAVHGASALPAGVRRTLMVLSGVAVVYSFGSYGGLATLIQPELRWFRFPVKALLTPYLCVALWAGAGLDRLRRCDRVGRLVLWSVLASAALALLGLAATLGHGAIAAWLDASPRSEAIMAETLRSESVAGVALALTLAAIAVSVKARWLPAGRGSWMVLALLVADLSRGAVGVNPQTSTRFFEPAPGLLPLLGDLGAGRVFSLGVDSSPAMRGFLDRHEPDVGRSSFMVTRRLLVPFTNLLDGVDLAEGSDRLSFIPARPALPGAAYAPEAIGLILPRLRDDAVTRILSLDPLVDDGLQLRGSVPAGPEGLRIHVYTVSDPLPRAYLACGRAAEAAAPAAGGPSPKGGIHADPGRGCGGSVSRRVALGSLETYDVEAVDSTLLVMRDNFTPSWTAAVDGHVATVVRANGWQRAVAVPAGRHRVVLRYEPPGLVAGLTGTAIAVALCLLLWVRPVLEASRVEAAR